jgi:4-diphosphocytidyl-2-C-methyl-D-erythritol kinase
MIRVFAPAKINLFLEITGKRPDGYHRLSTVFQTISLGDELTFSAADDLSLTCSDRSLPVDSSNLVMKAALRLQDALKEPRGAKIHLEKKVPMGAGLGGGSSDAAAVLQALLKLWKRKMPQDALAALAVKLGADVPFFLQGGICAAVGIGEQLKPLKPLPKTWLVLVYPGFGVSTKDAYSKVIIPAKPKGSDPMLKGGLTPSNLFNRFEEFVFPDHPELPRLKRDFLETGAIASLMSGSGSSVFGIAHSRTHGMQILARLQKKYNHCWLVHTR